MRNAIPAAAAALTGEPFCAVIARREGAFEVRERLYGPGLCFDRHHHDHTSLFAVLSGGVEESSPSMTLECGEGSVGLIPAGVEHRSRFGNSAVHSLDVVLDPVWLEGCGLWPRALKQGVYFRADVLAACAHRLLRACRRPDAHGGLAAEELVLELMSQTLAPGGGEGRAAARARAPWLDGVMDLLRSADPAHELTTIAKAVGRNPAHICRAFRAAFGCSMHEYARMARIERAAVRLRTTDEPLVGIAMEMGFSDQAHFTRTFKSVMGMTPLAYRRSSN